MVGDRGEWLTMVDSSYINNGYNKTSSKVVERRCLWPKNAYMMVKNDGETMLNSGHKMAD